jgi:SAM-dependent methyltransferase
MNSCIFCGHNEFRSSAYEQTIFNFKEFEYKRCKNCKLIQLFPLPSGDDFNKMYDTYQSVIDTKPNGIYNGVIDLIKKYSAGKRLLDYGCGNGRFLKELDSEEFELSGTEFSSEFVAKLGELFPNIRFQTINSFLEKSQSEYDVIFISNVLEHLTNPKEILETLKKKLAPGGIFVIEGPLEEGMNLAYLFRKTFFSIRKKLTNKKADYIPFHIFKANYTNQLMLFKSIGLQCLYYECGESPWPFPFTFNEAKGFSKKIQYYIGQASVRFSRNKKKWGNQFLFIGQIKRND